MTAAEAMFLGASVSAETQRVPLPRGLVRVSTVEPEHVRWVWPGRIPAAKLTVFDGDPSLGKSTVTLDLAARITTGSPMPDGTRSDTPSGSVLLLSAEDGIGDTIRPRLAAADADLDRVIVVDTITSTDDEGRVTQRPPTIPGDSDILARLVDELDVVLVIIDPAMAYLGARIDTRSDSDVRRAMHALKMLAEDTGTAVLLVRHLNKSGGSSPLYRGGGSIGFIGAARSGLLVAADPEDPDRRIVAVTKSNLAQAAPALAYRLITDELHGVARVAWQGETAHTAGDLLAMPADDEERSARQEAELFLIELLEGGPVAAKEAQAAAKEAGIGLRTLDRTRQRLGIRTRKEGFGAAGRWVWEAPDTLLSRHEPPLDTKDPHSQRVDALGVLDGLGGDIVDPPRANRHSQGGT